MFLLCGYETWYFTLLMVKLFPSYLKMKKNNKIPVSLVTTDYGRRDNFRNVVYIKYTIPQSMKNIQHNNGVMFQPLPQNL
jgi:hypothetical protein